MKIITEDLENNLVTEEVVNEVTGKKDLYIKGIMIQQEQKNRNGRVYPSSIMEREVTKYIAEYVNTGKAYGELNHPATMSVNPDRISHRIVELKKEGDNYIGKAIVLDTDAGNIIRAAITSGGAFGMSTRGAGTLKESNGVKIVQDDFHLCCVDAVIDPSAHDAWVNGIYESVNFEWKDGTLVEAEEEKIVEAKKRKVKNKNTKEFKDKDLWNSSAKKNKLSISQDKDGNFTASNKDKVVVGEWDADDNYGFIDESKTASQVEAFESFMSKLSNL